jgi:hypothetical protein
MPGTYEPLATTTGTGSSTTVTFTTIPQTYTDLVLVCSDINAQTTDIGVRFNNDSGSNYGRVVAFADLSGGPQTFRNAPGNAVYTTYRDLASTSDKLVFAVTHIMSYSNTTTVKPCFTRTQTVGGVGPITTMMIGSTWFATPAAITRIDIFSTLNNFSTTCKFTLYGIKAA